jgi:hypothetical protein
VDALVNMSQMTVSPMSIHDTTPSRQQRQHWLGEQSPSVTIVSWGRVSSAAMSVRRAVEQPWISPSRLNEARGSNMHNN